MRKIIKGKLCKKTMALLIATTMIAMGTPVNKTFAESEGRSDGTYYYTVQDDGNAVIGGIRGDATIGEELYIPSVIDGHTVVGVESIYNDDLIKIVLPDTVKSVGRIGGMNLETVVLPESVEEIKDYSLSNNSNLKTVEWSDNLKKIGEQAFYNCPSLKNITLNEGITSIGRYAFGYCSGLENIRIPDTCKVIYDQCFDECSNLESIEMPDNITIGARAFLNDAKLDDITFYESKIPRNDNGDSQVIGDYAFLATAIKEISIPEGYVHIGTYAFQSCEKLEKAILPESMKNISVYTFVDCAALKSITIKGAVEGVSAPISAMCSSLKEVTFTNVKKIPDYYLLNMMALEKVNLPETLEEIGTATFSECYALKNVVLPDSLKVIGTASFATCSSLESINIPQNVESIQPNSFYHCEALKHITVDAANDNFVVYENSIYTKDMKKLVLYNPASKESVVKILPGVEEIGYGVFQYNSYIKEIIIPDSVQVMGQGCINSDVKIYGKSEGAAHDYAMENGNEFVAISDEINMTDGVYVEGFQINPFNNGIRTIYVYPKMINEKEVVERGLVYGLKDYCDEEDVYVGSSCKDVFSYKATEKGNTAAMFTDSYTDSFNYETNDKYVMTMKYDDPFENSRMYMSNMYVRPYIKLADGSFYYGECAEFSFYDLADKLYKNSQMPNAEMHNILFDNILSVLKPGYSKVVYGEK
jgi:hypothetical protein